MTKKLLSLTILLVLMASWKAEAQVCTPSQLYVAAGLPGIWPNPQLSDLKDGKEGDAYSDVLTVIVPSDTTLDLSALTGVPGLPTITVAINYFEIGALTGLPTGLSGSCEPANCQYPDSSNGCLSVAGTPTQSGTFTVSVPLSINVDVPASVPVIGGGPFSTPAVPTDYALLIEPKVGIADDLNRHKFELGQSVPNPTEGLTTINYTYPNVGNLEFSVFNLLGSEVYSSEVQAKRGLNEINFDGSNLHPGIYFYSINNGDVALTKRLVIAR